LAVERNALRPPGAARSLEIALLVFEQKILMVTVHGLVQTQKDLVRCLNEIDKTGCSLFHLCDLLLGSWGNRDG
jgi:hypothetical protein